MQIVAIALGFFVLTLTNVLAHEERTSEWIYVDERWPKHIGPLTDEADPDAYIHKVVGVESARINGWRGRQKSVALDTVTACGLHFDGYIRQRPRGTYLIVVISSADKKDHRLKWIPLEYRFDDADPRYFSRRDGGPNEEAKGNKVDYQHEPHEYLDTPGGRPDPRTEPILRRSLKYLFDNTSPRYQMRTRGGALILAKHKYLEVVKFPAPHDLTEHDWLQIYLPWVDDCPTKPEFQFRRNNREEVVWDYHMNTWISVGVQYSLPLHTGDWASLHPQPAYYLRFADFAWGHHGFTVEAQLATFHGPVGGGTSTTGVLGRASYAYAFWFEKYLTLSIEPGLRLVAGSGTVLPGFGVGPNLAWEVPGTRHQTTGQRLLFEGGCDFEFHPAGSFNGRDLRGAWGNCKIGFGLGW